MQRFIPRRSRRSETARQGNGLCGRHFMRLLNAVVITAVMTIGYIWLPAIPAQFRQKLGSYVAYALVPTLLIVVLLFLIYRTMRRQYVVVREYDAMRRRAVDASRRKSRFL